MPRLIWSPAALLDVQRLHQFLSAKSPDVARRAVKTIRQGVHVLSQQPAIGRPAEHMENEFRKWLIDFGDSGYVALYRFDGQSAVILAVPHQRKFRVSLESTQI